MVGVDLPDVTIRQRAMADVDDVACTGLTLLEEGAKAPEAAFAVQRVLLAAGRNPTVGFPFGNPVSFEWRHLPLLRVAYRVAPKTNGVRVALVLGVVPPPAGVASPSSAAGSAAAGAAPCAFLMDRTCRLFGLPLTAAPAWVFERGGTLLDAELVQDPARDGAWRLVVFDGALVGGLSMQQAPLSVRLQMAAGVVDKLAAPGFAFGVKTMVPLVAGVTAEAVLGPEPRLPSDGFVLTPEYAGATTAGTAETVFKLKDPHTLDIWWADTGLWYGDGADFVSLAMLRPEVVVQGLPDTPPVKPVVVELAITAVSDRTLTLQFVAHRPGKHAPNNARCVMRTLVSAQEGVTLADIVSRCADPSYSE